MRSRLVALAVLLCVFAAACQAEQEPSSAAPEESPTATPEPTPEPEPVRCPLMGVELPPHLELERPALGVKIDNHPRARPHVGMEYADIVYEELVEGGMTRFLAIYHCGDAADLGPVRSAREVDPDILVPYSPVLFAYSGASPNNLRKIAATAGIIDLEHGKAGSAYSRRGGRAAPHNLFTSTDRIRSLGAAQGIEGPPRTGFVFNPDLDDPSPPPQQPAQAEDPEATDPGTESAPGPDPSAPQPANRVSFSYSGGGAVVSYSYDPVSRQYNRAVGGTPHRSAAGNQMSGRNVLVLMVPVSRAGSSPHITVLGEGEAIVLRNGEAIRGRWVRPHMPDQMTVIDGNNEQIELAPGNTWINLVPNDRQATLE